ncbi:hypothetical protein D3C72_1329540 [compost metagenome]
MTAASCALRAMTPMWSNDAASSRVPCRLTRPQVGLMPVRPVAAQGQRMDPPVSDAVAAKQSPAAVATAEPLDEMPVQ